MNQRSRGLIPDLDRRLATQRILLEAVHHVVRGVPVDVYKRQVPPTIMNFSIHLVGSSHCLG